MKNYLRLVSALLTVIMIAALFAVIPVSPSFAEDGENIALGKPVRTNKESAKASAITDGDPSTFWSANWIPLYAEVDLQENYVLNKVVVKQPPKNINVRSYECAFNVYGSSDGVHFDRIGQMETPQKATDEGFTFEIDTGIPYRVVRVMSTMSTRGTYAYTVLSEIEVYGERSEVPVTETRTSIEFPSYDRWLLENCGVDISAIRDKDGKYDIEDTYTAEDTLEALNGLVTRLLGEEYLSWFDFEVGEPLKNKNDYYEISDGEGTVRIKGNTGVSIAAGLNHYLKYFCKVHISQETAQVRMPDAVVPVGEAIHTECSVPVRYTYNYCTLSYTMPYYGFDEWQRELDYLMLSGVNVILDTTATEALWVMYLQQFGYTLEEAKQFVCGYVWKAWWLMGNLEGYGGPVSDEWIVDTVEMARVNQRYMTVMGAQPCLQAFVGTLPTDFASKANKTLMDLGFENIAPKMTGTGSWVGFTRPYSLNTTYNGFTYLAERFYDVQNYIYGRIGDYYAGDFLHEVDSGFKLDPQFDKANMSRTVLDNLLAENDEAVWIIQSWWENPLPEVVAGWGEDRVDHMLLLDLSAVQSPRWSNKDPDKFGGLEFGGSSWCYCILEDYGGREGLHGKLYSMVKDFANALHRAKHLRGIGLTAEGTERTPATFDLFWEMAWDPSIDARKWIVDYAERRCGTTDAQEAWQMLVNSVYGMKTVDGTTINMAMCQYPKFDITGAYFISNYKTDVFADAMNALIALYDTCKDKETYVYDLVELLTTELSNETCRLLGKAFTAAKNADYETFHACKTKFLYGIRLADELNAFSKNQLLGNWVGRVDKFVSDPRTGTYSDFDVDLMKLDSVILITNWSTIDLGNYANRTYSGLIEDYYYRMWSLFMNEAEARIKEGKAITSGSDSLGINGNTVCYNIGREAALAAMFGSKNYPDTPTPVDGDIAHRSFKEVITEIAAFYLGAPECEATTVCLREGSTLEANDGTVTGTLHSLTAADISAQFDATNGAKVGVMNGETLLLDGDLAETGMKLVIVENDGSIFDALDLTVGQIDVDPAGETASMSGALLEYVRGYAETDTTDFNSRARFSLDAFAAKASAAVESGSYALIKAAFDRLYDAMALYVGEASTVRKICEDRYASLAAEHAALTEQYNAVKAKTAVPDKIDDLFDLVRVRFAGTVIPDNYESLNSISKLVEQERRALLTLTAPKTSTVNALEDAPFAPGGLFVFLFGMD